MAKNPREIEEELLKIKKDLQEISSKAISGQQASELSDLAKYLTDERERTNRILAGLARKIRDLEESLKAEREEQIVENNLPRGKEVPISSTDAQILLFIQEHTMACAEDLRTYMKYKGKNAASARLNKLYKAGLLERFQLGHKVYYKYDAGKTTNTLIVYPPQ